MGNVTHLNTTYWEWVVRPPPARWTTPQHKKEPPNPKPGIKLPRCAKPPSSVRFRCSVVKLAHLTPFARRNFNSPPGVAFLFLLSNKRGRTSTSTFAGAPPRRFFPAAFEPVPAKWSPAATDRVSSPVELDLTPRLPEFARCSRHHCGSLPFFITSPKFPKMTEVNVKVHSKMFVPI